MADASQAQIIAVPAGNGIKSVLRYDFQLGPSNVRRILLTWPAGCGGLVFLQVQAGGGYAFPNQQNQFLAFDDYTYVFDVTGQINNGNWSIIAYNLDFIDHDPIIVFEFDYLHDDVTQSSVTPIAL